MTVIKHTIWERNHCAAAALPTNSRTLLGLQVKFSSKIVSPKSKLKDLKFVFASYFGAKHTIWEKNYCAAAALPTNS